MEGWRVECSALADVIDAHVYRIDDWETTTQEVILKLVDFTLALGEREIGRPITPEDFPKAPPESMGNSPSGLHAKRWIDEVRTR